MAVVPALTDFTFMEAKNAKLFVNSPNALEGNKTENTANAAFQLSLIHILLCIWQIPMCQRAFMTTY